MMTTVDPPHPDFRTPARHSNSWNEVTMIDDNCSLFPPFITPARSLAFPGFRDIHLVLGLCMQHHTPPAIPAMI